MQPKRIHLTGAERRAMYADMKSRKVGEPCVCPVCGEVFIKRSYQQAFCCTKCKDWFWNRRGDRHSAGYQERYLARKCEEMRAEERRKWQEYEEKIVEEYREKERRRRERIAWSGNEKAWQIAEALGDDFYVDDYGNIKKHTYFGGW